MPALKNPIVRAAFAFGLLVASGSAQTLAPEVQAKVQAKAK
jgi:outer membrane lipoprotein-sorting protein